MTVVVLLGFASHEALPSVVKTTHPREWWSLCPPGTRSRHKEANGEQPKPDRPMVPSAVRGTLGPSAALVVHREDRNSVVSPGIRVWSVAGAPADSYRNGFLSPATAGIHPAR